MPLLERTMKTMRLADDVRTAEAELDTGVFSTQEEEIRKAHAERVRLTGARQSRVRRPFATRSQSASM